MKTNKLPIYLLSSLTIFSLLACSSDKTLTANKLVTFDNCEFTVNGDSAPLDFEENFKSLFVTEEVGCILESFEHSKLNIDNQVGITTLRLGTAKVGGMLNLNFKYDISEIKINVQPYYKNYGGSTHPDFNSLLNIYSSEQLVTSIDMTTTDDTVLEAKDNIIAFTNPTKNIKLDAPNAGGRVLIHYLDISFDYNI